MIDAIEYNLEIFKKMLLRQITISVSCLDFRRIINQKNLLRWIDDKLFVNTSDNADSLNINGLEVVGFALCRQSYISGWIFA